MKIFFKGVPYVYCAKFMLTVFHNGNPIIYIKYRGKIRPQSSQGEKRPGDEIESNRLKFRLLLEGDI